MSSKQRFTRTGRGYITRHVSNLAAWHAHKYLRNINPACLPIAEFSEAVKAVTRMITCNIYTAALLLRHNSTHSNSASVL